MHELLSPEIEQETIPVLGLAIFNNESVLLIKHSTETGETYSLPAQIYTLQENEREVAKNLLKQVTGLSTEIDSFITDQTKSYITKVPGEDQPNKKALLKVFIPLRYEGGIQNNTEWIKLADLDHLNCQETTIQVIKDASKFLHTFNLNRKITIT